jgi:hypothetical protein
MGEIKQFEKFKRSITALSYTSLLGIVFLLCLPFLNLSCANTKMSVEEAKRVTVKIGSESFSPPPRRIDDILILLSQPGQFDTIITLKYRAAAGKSPPENANDSNLSDFYLNRGKAALRLALFNQGLEDLRTAYQYARDCPVARVHI